MRLSGLLLAGGLASFSLASHAQSTPVVGFVNGSSAEGYAPYVRAFREGLKEAGFVEGRSVVIEYRWAENQYDKLPQLLADLVERRVAVIAATSTPAALAAKYANISTPVVFTTASNPVDLGLVASLGHPGGNMTGASQMTVEVGPKRLELLRQVLPTAKTMALLLNPTSPNAKAVEDDSIAAAHVLGVELEVVYASAEEEIATAFAQAARLGATGLIVGTDPLFNGQSAMVASLGRQRSMPTVYQYREFASAGGLIAYGGSISASYRIAGVLTDRILKGESPANLPVEQSAKVELIVNLETAKALGLNLPITLLGRADEVIE